MELKTVKEAALKGKTVLMRVDFNVPMKNGEVQDDTRIRAALPTIEYILGEDVKGLILMSHLGDPKKDVKKAREKAEAGGQPFDEEAFINGKNRMKPVSEYLAKILGKPVAFCPETTGPKALEAAKKLSDGAVLMLENTRFDSRETSKDASERDAMAKELAELADIYVNDAFGTAHRDHASTCSVTKFMHGEVYAGFLMEKEVQYLDPIVNNPAKPMVAIIGGAKVSSKIAVLESLLKNAGALIIGGGMAYTFLKAQGHKVGKSLIEDDYLDTARKVLEQAKAKNIKILLPLDHKAAREFADVTPVDVPEIDLADDLMGLDVGPKTLESYKEVLSSAKTVVWNGPVGVFEFNNFASGTEALAKMVAEVKARGGISVVGGGDSVAAVNKFKLADQMSHVSTGGGASLEYLEGKTLPGIAALKK
jgi:3-phosphoglycerate kinase